MHVCTHKQRTDTHALTLTHRISRSHYLRALDATVSRFHTHTRIQCIYHIYTHAHRPSIEEETNPFVVLNEYVTDVIMRQYNNEANERRRNCKRNFFFFFLWKKKWLKAFFYYFIYVCVFFYVLLKKIRSWKFLLISNDDLGIKEIDCSSAKFDHSRESSFILVNVRLHSSDLLKARNDTDVFSDTVSLIANSTRPRALSFDVIYHYFSLYFFSLFFTFPYSHLILLQFLFSFGLTPFFLLFFFLERWYTLWRTINNNDRECQWICFGVSLEVNKKKKKTEWFSCEISARWVLSADDKRDYSVKRALRRRRMDDVESVNQPPVILLVKLL